MWCENLLPLNQNREAQKDTVLECQTMTTSSIFHGTSAMFAEEKLKRRRVDMEEGCGVCSCREKTYVLTVFHRRTRSGKFASEEKGKDGGAKDASGPSVSCGAGRGR